MCEKDQSCSTDNKSVALPSDSWFSYLSLILPLVWDIHIYVVFVRLLLILSTKHVTFSNWKPSIKFNVTHRELRKRIEDRKYIYKWPFSLGGQYGCLSFLNIHLCIYFFHTSSVWQDPFYNFFYFNRTDIWTLSDFSLLVNNGILIFSCIIQVYGKRRQQDRHPVSPSCLTSVFIYIIKKTGHFNRIKKKLFWTFDNELCNTFLIVSDNI